MCIRCAYSDLSQWISIELKNHDTPFNSQYYAKKIQEGKLPQTGYKWNLIQT